MNTMDVFVEQLFKRKNKMSENALRVGLFIACGLMAGIVIIFAINILSGRLLPIAALIAAGLCYLAFYMSGMLNIEYEYCLTNSTFDVDAVINERKRKRLASFECKNVDDFGVYDSNRNYNCNTTLFAANADSSSLYYAVFQYKDKGKMLLVIEPDDRMIAGLKRCLPRQVVRNVFGGN